MQIISTLLKLGRRNISPIWCWVRITWWYNVTQTRQWYSCLTIETWYFLYKLLLISYSNGPRNFLLWLLLIFQTHFFSCVENSSPNKYSFIGVQLYNYKYALNIFQSRYIPFRIVTSALGFRYMLVCWNSSSELVSYLQTCIFCIINTRLLDIKLHVHTSGNWGSAKWFTSGGEFINTRLGYSSSNFTTWVWPPLAASMIIVEPS